MKKILIAIILLSLGVLNTFGKQENELVHKESTDEFNTFLQLCTLEERIALAQSLKYLPNIPRKLYGERWNDNNGNCIFELKRYEEYASDTKSSIETGKPIKPQTFNEIPVEYVKAAIAKNYVNISDFNASKIKEQLLWASSHWSTYYFRSKDNIKYGEIVDWVAKKNGVGAWDIQYMSTQALSEKLAMMRGIKLVGKAWDKLNAKQREKLLTQLDVEQKLTTNEKTAIIAGTSGTFLASLATVSSISGFAFYTTTTSLLCSSAGIIGVTLPFSAYVATTTGLAAATGPVGWTVAGGLLVTTPFLVGWADVDKTTNFVITKALIQKGHANTK